MTDILTRFGIPMNGLVPLATGCIMLVIIIAIIIYATTGKKEHMRLGASIAAINEDIIRNDMHNSLTNKAAYPPSTHAGSANDILNVVIRSDIQSIITDQEFIRVAFTQIAKRMPLRIESLYYGKLLRTRRATRTDIIMDIINKDSVRKSRLIATLYQKYMGRQPTHEEVDMYSGILWTLKGPLGSPDYAAITVEAKISKLPEAQFRTGIDRLFFKYMKRSPNRKEYKHFYSMWYNVHDPIKLEAIEQILRRLSPTYNHDYIEVSGSSPGTQLFVDRNPIQTYWSNKGGTMATSRVVGKMRQGVTTRMDQHTSFNKTNIFR